MGVPEQQLTRDHFFLQLGDTTPIPMNDFEITRSAILSPSCERIHLSTNAACSYFTTLLDFSYKKLFLT